MWCCMRKSSLHSKIGIASASPHCCEIAPSIPIAFSLEVKSKYSAIHLCCSFSKNFMFYMGGIVSKGPIVVPDRNESIHTSEMLLMLTNSSNSRSRRKLAKLQSHMYLHNHLRDKDRSEINKTCTHSQKHIFHIVSKLCALHFRRLINI